MKSVITYEKERLEFDENSSSLVCKETGKDFNKENVMKVKGKKFLVQVKFENEKINIFEFLENHDVSELESCEVFILTPSTQEGLWIEIDEDDWKAQKGIDRRLVSMRIKYGWNAGWAWLCPICPDEKAWLSYSIRGAPARLYVYDGMLLSLKAISAITGVNSSTLRYRVESGMTIDDAISHTAYKPTQKRPRIKERTEDDVDILSRLDALTTQAEALTAKIDKIIEMLERV